MDATPSYLKHYYSAIRMNVVLPTHVAQVQTTARHPTLADGMNHTI